MTFHIYHLVDPITHLVRYVGRCTDPKARLRNHCNEAARRQTTDKHRWNNTRNLCKKLHESFLWPR